jgi:hypothetical protein
MTEPTDSASFPELSQLIKDYAGGDLERQVKALQAIAGVYVPLFEVPPMEDIKQVVQDIIERNDFLVTTGGFGELEPASVEAVVAAATYGLNEADMRWGADLLLRVMGALGRRAATEGYETFVSDAALVLEGMERILALDIAEDIVEDIVEDMLEDGS